MGKILNHTMSWTIMFLGIVALIFYIATWCSDDDFKAIKFTQPTILSDPIVPGQDVELTNGICNLINQEVTVEIWLALKSDGDGLLQNFQQNILGSRDHGSRETLAPKGQDGDCIAERIVTLVPANSQLPPGRWRLIGEVQVPGSQFGKSGIVQEEIVRSNNAFTIVEGP